MLPCELQKKDITMQAVHVALKQRVHLMLAYFEHPNLHTYAVQYLENEKLFDQL